MVIKSKEIVFASGEIVVLRSAKTEDAESLCRHRYITSEETYFMARYPEECEQDIYKIQANLLDIEKHSRNFMIIAFIDNQIVGDLGVKQIRSHLKYCHRAYMGISIQKQYCNLGLGSIMIEIALEYVEKRGFEQLELGVFEDNLRAIHLYEKYGFKKYGIQPKAFKLKDGSYRNEIIMVNIL